jgi:hypothetical protein
MKKLFIITSVLALGAIGSFAQGTISGINGGSGVLIQVENPSLNGGAPVTIGKPATAVGFSAADVGPGAVTAYFYAAANGTSLSALESANNLVFTEASSTSTLTGAQGTLNGANQTLPTSSVFSGNSQIEVIAYGVSGTGAYTGWSSEATGITPATGTAQTPAIFGTSPGLINSFLLVPTPEPSTIALGGLGAAALLMFRRRK